MFQPYIPKAGDAGDQTPQTIWIFRRKIVWERENYQSEYPRTNKSQEVLKSFAEKPQMIYMFLVSDLSRFCFQIMHL